MKTAFAKPGNYTFIRHKIGKKRNNRKKAKQLKQAKDAR